MLYAAMAPRKDPKLPPLYASIVLSGQFLYLRNKFNAANRLCRLYTKNKYAVTGMPGSKLFDVFIPKNIASARVGFLLIAGR